MPLPKRRKGESRKKFVSRCMENIVMKDEFSIQQRIAICSDLGGRKRRRGRK